MLEHKLEELLRWRNMKVAQNLCGYKPAARVGGIRCSTAAAEMNATPIPISSPKFIRTNRPIAITTVRRSAVTEGVSAITSDPAQAEVSWQIVVGALAGVAPFVVAGIEFSKRIVEQRNCKVCKGSGLVLRDNKYYFRCPRCGGFLPWQSWKRFFTG